MIQHSSVLITVVSCWKHLQRIEVEPVFTYLIMWQYNEGTSACRLDDDGEELRVDRAERGVPAALGDPDVVVALFPFKRLAVNVPKFWTSHNTKRHFAPSALLLGGFFALQILTNFEDLERTSSDLSQHSPDICSTDYLAIFDTGNLGYTQFGISHSHWISSNKKH